MTVSFTRGAAVALALSFTLLAPAAQGQEAAGRVRVDRSDRTARVESTSEVVELMTVTLRGRSDSGADLVIEWDRTRAFVPIVLGSVPDGTMAPGTKGPDRMGGRMRR